MNVLLHVLGTDIPHHNHTLLRFFNDQLAPTQAHARQFMLVSRQPETELVAAYPALTLHCYADEKQLVQALVATVHTDCRQRVLLHGQYNRWLWLALLSGRLPGRMVSWHVWGADLYETATGWRHWLFYRLRRLAQRRVARVFATRGDLYHLAQRLPHLPGELLYFPGKMPATTPAVASVVDKQQNRQPLTILVGNSGDRSNQHIAALRAIYQQFADQVTLIVPMGYPTGNEHYIQQVKQAAATLFAADRLHILLDNLAFDDYLQLVLRCDLGYFLFARQQGVGTLSLLIQANIPCVLSRDNPFWRDMKEQNLPVLFSDEPLSIDCIRQARQQLQQKNKSQIAFFSPGYLPLWQQALYSAAEEQA